jgi:hypothetical protein
MSSVGYSGKPLLSKLGYLAGDSVLLVSAPDWFRQHLDASGILTISTLPATWAHMFLTEQKDLRHLASSLELSMIEKGLWLSWPKRASKIPTDISENDLRDAILPLGWVDVKVAAVDDDWSGLKFLRRKQ